MHNNQKLFDTALSKVIAFLAYSSRTKKEVVGRVKLYLSKKDLTKIETDEIVNYVLEEIEKLGLLDDSVYAKNYVEGRLRSGRAISKRKIQDFLFKKGVDRQTVEKALQSYPKGMEVELVKELAKKKLKTLRYTNTNTGKRKLATYLLGKGFSSTAVFETINQLFTQD